MNLDSVIKIKICGRNVNNYIRRMVKRKINFIRIIPLSDNEVNVILRYSDYLLLISYKSILYDVSIIEKYGLLKVKDKISTNKILILFSILGCILLYLLSNMIFKVEVIHQDKNIRSLIYDELRDYGIHKYSFKKSYIELERIEDEILDNNKEKLEWIEIVINGTFVEVKVEERVINDDENIFKYQNIVSKKNAVITDVKAVRGEIVKEEGIYVKKGDVVISGEIVHPNNSKSLTMALGEVYGEVWYEIDIDYPFVYQESNLTGRCDSGLKLKFFDRQFRFFSKENYKSFSSKNKILVSDNLLNLEIIREKRYELDIRDEVYTEELVESKAVSYIREKIMSDNSDIKDIIGVEVLDREIDYDGINFKFFVTTLESIGEAEEMVGETEE